MKSMKICYTFSCLVLLCSISIKPLTLTAQDRFEEVEVLEHPRFSLRERFVVDAELSFLPMDAHYKPILLDIAASYQIFDWLTLEPVRLGLSLHNHDTGLTGAFETTVQNELLDQGVENPDNFVLKSGQDLKNLRYRLGSAGLLNMLYSKSNLFNLSVVYHYWQTGLGFSYYNMDKADQISLDLIMRVRFFINNNWILNLRGSHSFGFSQDAPQNISSLGFGGGYAF